MASGDSQRAWFPEMIDDLRREWNPSMSWEAYADFCDKMTNKRKTIKAEKGIKPVKGWCKNCQKYHDMEPPTISIRSLLFTLKKISLINNAEFIKLESEWKRYQRVNKLDAYGKKL
jgi:hypothetical protein